MQEVGTYIEFDVGAQVVQQLDGVVGDGGLDALEEDVQVVPVSESCDKNRRDANGMQAAVAIGSHNISHMHRTGRHAMKASRTPCYAVMPNVRNIVERETQKWKHISASHRHSKSRIMQDNQLPVPHPLCIKKILLM
jgi:hypothetical protein